MCLTVACANEDIEKAELIDIEYDLQDKSDNTLKDSTELYDNAIQWLTDDYREANKTAPLDGADDCPGEIINTITSQEEFDKAFNEFPTEVNFDEQMLVLYFEAPNSIFYINGKRLYYYELINATYKENIITFDILTTKTDLLISGEIDPPDASEPTHLCLALVVPKMDIKEVKFAFGYKKYYITWKGDLKSSSKVYKADFEWLREEYKEENISGLKYPDKLTDKILTHDQFVTAFRKFYNNFVIQKDMLVLYFFTQESTDKNIYEYSIADVEYEYGYLDIRINKKVVGTQSGDIAEDKGFLAIKLPQLPAYNVNVTIN